jgi:hypothetical protein
METLTAFTDTIALAHFPGADTLVATTWAFIALAGAV